MKDVIAIGELLIDFIGGEGSIEETEDFKKCFGGAPGNFAVACSRLNLKTGLISRVGNDGFGFFLLNTLKKEGVDINNVEIDKSHRTGLAFVSHIKEREFIFYRGAEMFIEGPKKLEKARYVCFGSITLITPVSRRSTLRIIKEARKNNSKICFDPNIRLNLWKEDTMRWVLRAMKYTDMLLLTEDEMKFIFKKRIEDCIKIIKNKFRINIIGIKRGENGCIIVNKDKIIKIPAFKVKPIDSTGAGDAWNAGFIYGLIKGFDLERSGKIANMCGALCVSKKGAISALPREKDLQNFLKTT